jgi:hypothetical protein
VPVGKDLTGYDFLSVSKEEFVPVSVKPASKVWLDNVEYAKECRVVTTSHGAISVYYEQYVRGHRGFQ